LEIEVSTDREDAPKLGVCTLTMNSEVSISCVLESLIRQKYPKDRVFYLVVDGGSSDRTLEVVREVLGKGIGMKYDIVLAAGSNIPQARNVCLERLLQVGVDYVLFVDSDTVVALVNAFQLITQLAKGRKSLIHFTTEFRCFKDADELHKFVSGLQPAEVSVAEEDLIPSLRIGMGFTIIPRDLAASLKFEEDMDFAEDHLYALKALSFGYTPYIVRKALPIYDVNIAGSKGDIYWRMPVSRYLRSARKKTLHVLIACVEDGSLKFSHKRLLRVLTKHLVNAGLLALLLSLPLLAVVDLKLFTAGALARIGVTLGYATHKKLKGFSLVEGLKNRLKFELHSALILLNLPLAYRDIMRILREASRRG
jgi:glycosyltransferase involved in cell wall biosynthesis